MRWLRRKSWLKDHPGIEGDYQEIMHALDRSEAKPKGVGFNPPTRGDVNYGLFSVAQVITYKGGWRWGPDRPIDHRFKALVAHDATPEKPWR